MSKETLCAWKKDDIREKLAELRGLVANPAYVCRRCGRAANTPDVLCKPISLETGKKVKSEDDGD